LERRGPDLAQLGFIPHGKSKTMSSIAPTKPERKNLTEALCQAAVTKRIRHYDQRCPGLFVSCTPKGATFFLRYSCRITRKRCIIQVGVYHPQQFNVKHARIEAMALKVRIGNGEDVAQTARQAHRLQAKLSGISVGQIIDERIAWVSELVPKGRAKDGVTLKMGPRKKDWANMASHLNRFVKPRLGRMVASEVTRDDIRQLQKDILAGALIINGRPCKASISSARHMRKAVSGLFKWAAINDYVSTSPCVNLPPLDREPPRTRKLSPDEITVLWHGLDRDDIAVDRRICLAIKFALVTMLRSTELLHIHRDELGRNGLNSELPQVDVPEERVKAARTIHQPLSSLAVEIARESLGNYSWLFAGRFGDEPLNRKAMACALRGTKRKVNGKMVTKTIGLCELLGIKPFTPHDLRRTAASLMGSLGIPRSTVAACLDHTIKSDDLGVVSAVTGKHYDQDPRIAEKRAALQKLADELRRIIDSPVHVKGADAEMRLAA
jgi:integrase